MRKYKRPKPSSDPMPFLGNIPETTRAPNSPRRIFRTVFAVTVVQHVVASGAVWIVANAICCVEALRSGNGFPFQLM